MALGDFNHDGNLDLATTTPNGVAILLGVGNGTFRKAVYYAVGGYYQGSLAVGDFNGDGHQDILVGGTTESSLLLGNGDGTFKTALEMPGIIGGSVVLGDFDHDGNLDLAMVDASLVTVGIGLGRGDASFQPLQYFAVSGEPPSLAVAALTSSGKPDIIVPEEDGHISVMLNNTKP